MFDTLKPTDDSRDTCADDTFDGDLNEVQRLFQNIQRLTIRQSSSLRRSFR